MSVTPRKSISRSVGEFFGYIARGFRTRVDDAGREVDRTEVSRTVEQETRGENVILRRTTIEEVEVRRTTNLHGQDDSARDGTPSR